jgi:EmrB/QacA subfamily drug resistance transporter
MAPEAAGRSHAGRAIATVAIVGGTFMSVLGSTVLNVPVGAIAKDLHVSIADATLLITTQAVTFATFLPIADWIGNRFGRRNIYCAVLFGYSIAGIVGALAPNLGVLIAVRIVQGMCASGIVPLVMTLLSELYEPHERPLALSAWAMANSAGQACGPPLGGLLAMYFGWRSIFVPPAMIGLFACAAAYRYLPADAPRVIPLEWRGALSLTAGSAFLLGAFVAIPQHGPLSAVVIVLAILGIACTALFVSSILTARTPFVSPRAFALASYRTPCIGVFSATMVFGSALLAIPLYLTQTLGLSLASAGFVTLTMPLAMALVAPFSSIVVKRAGSGLTMLLGLLVLGVATGSIAAAAANHLGVWSLLPAMVLIGASMAAMYTAGAVGTTHSEAGRYGAGIGFFNLVRVAGSAIGAAYVAIVLQADVGAYGVVFGIGTAVALLALVASIASEGRQNVIGNPT